jgi:hypothetical protein
VDTDGEGAGDEAPAVVVVSGVLLVAGDALEEDGTEPEGRRAVGPADRPEPDWFGLMSRSTPTTVRKTVAVSSRRGERGEGVGSDLICRPRT